MSSLLSSLRLVRNVALLLLVGCAGFALRGYRRLLRRPPRIWHGTFCSHLIPLQVAADRAAGFPSRSVVTSIPLSYELVRPDDFTVVLDQRGVRNHDLLWAGLFDLLLRGDIWVAFFDGLFYPVEREWENNFILGFLRAVGVRIVMVNYGGDVLTWQENRGRYDWPARLKRDYPHWDIEADTARTRRRIALFCKHAAFVCNGDSSIDRMMPRRDLVFKYFPVDCERLAPKLPQDTRRPVVVHAPQHRNVKGTDHLLEAARSLAAKGFQFELKLVERIPHREALSHYAAADIIADQFCIGAWGAFAQEGLALGKPVLTYLDHEHLSDPAFNLPIVNANPENLERVLAVLVSVPELRTRLGSAGRAAVERYHSFAAIGEVWARIYGHVWWGRPLSLETTAHFDPGRGTRPLTEDPGEAGYWPVPVEDLMADIESALRHERSGAPLERRVGNSRT